MRILKRITLHRVVCVLLLMTGAVSLSVSASESSCMYTAGEASPLHPEQTDSVESRGSMLRRSDNPDWWWNRLRKGELDLKDTTIIYPRFLKFCVNTYNWADRTFNSYDTTFVQGTGKRWKAVVKVTTGPTVMP